jgi:NADH:ubiquinone reductase (H+-translocating)
MSKGLTRLAWPRRSVPGARLRRGSGSGRRPHVVVVGGGFGGIQAALRLARQPIDVTLVDRRNFLLFQPLVYQVATGALAAAEIAYPLRAIIGDRSNVRVALAEAIGFDLGERVVRLGAVGDGPAPGPLRFDALIVAAGSRYNYFGHEEWQDLAPSPKTVEGALTIRRRILGAFEAAELEPDPERRAEWLTFVVVGAGPTGVEMAGQIAELAHDLCSEFRVFDFQQVRILLVEGLDHALSGFPPSLSEKAGRSLQGLGVTLRFGHTVTEIDRRSVTLMGADGVSERISARTVIWAAGVVASELAATLAESAGLSTDRAGRIPVLPDLSLAGHPNVLAIGDMISVHGDDGKTVTLPGVAPVAMQQGRHAAGVVHDRLQQRPSRPFHYHDKGNVATIGRARAVAEVKHLRLSGLPAWLLWLGVHLWYLSGFQNRLIVTIRWAFSFATHGRGARVIAGGQNDPLQPPESIGSVPQETLTPRSFESTR